MKIKMYTKATCFSFKGAPYEKTMCVVYDSINDINMVDISKVMLVKDAEISYMVKKIMDNGIVPVHAPGWAKMNDDQWVNKLIHMAEHPDKYQNSLLKETLLKACETYR